MSMNTIIDLGCGTGNNLEPYYDEYQVIGFDLDEKNIAICKEKMPNGEWHVADITDLDLSKYKHIEKIICTEVIEHLQDWKKLIAVLATAPDGAELELTTPYKTSEEKLLAMRPKYWDEIGHYHFFTGDEIAHALREAGWQNISVRRHNAALYFELRALFKRNAPCLRNTYYKNILPLWQKIFFLYFKPEVYQTRLKYVPIWLVTQPIAWFVLDPIWGAGIKIHAEK